MKNYALDEGTCRQAALLAYFGERFEAGRCGDRCDVCLGGCARGDDVWKVRLRM